MTCETCQFFRAKGEVTKIDRRRKDHDIEAEVMLCTEGWFTDWDNVDGQKYDISSPGCTGMFIPPQNFGCTRHQPKP